MVTSAAAELPLLTAGVLIKQIRDTFNRLLDVRKGGNNQRYAVADAALSAFAVFFTQSPSFLDYQVRMQKERGRNNATSLFGVHEIPSDQQTRNLLDPVPPEELAPLLIDIVDAVYRPGALETHRTLAGGFTVALDGTEYFASNAMSCPNCSTRTLANGQTQHFHVAVTPVLVAPGPAAVFPLPPAFVGPQDGHTNTYRYFNHLPLRDSDPRLPGPTLSRRARPVALAPDVLRTPARARSVPPLRLLGSTV